MAAENDISAVAFDLCDVLLYHDRHIDALVEECGVSQQEFRDFVGPLAVRADLGQLHFIDFHLAVAQFLALPTDSEHIINRLTPCPETHGLAQAVHDSGRLVVITTNIAAGAFELVRQRTGLLPDVPFSIVQSCELGIAKPDPSFYGATLEIIEKPAAQVLALDNQAANIAAALSVGIEGEVLDPDHPGIAVQALARRMPDLQLAA